MPGPVDAVLAIDLGTSSVKTLILGRNLQVFGRGQATYPTLHPREDRDEQHVEDWLTAIASASGNARRFALNATIVAIALTGQMHGTVAFDGHGEPLGDAVIWSDRRTAALSAAVREQLGPDLPQAIGGPLGAGYQALTLKWFHDNRTRVSSETARVASPVDAIGYLLTGRLATDPSNAVGTGMFDARSMTWRRELIEAMSVRPELLPDLIETGSPIGSLTDQGAALLDLEPGLPVFHCGGDCAASAIGGQVLSDASTMVTLSTGAQVIRPVRTYAPEPEGRWHTWPAAIPPGCDADRWISVGALLNAGRALGWIHRTLALGSSIAEVIALADVAEAGSGGVLFLPYLVGERTPLTDPHARGAFIGLGETHEAHHLIRAVVEGIALSIADVLDRMTGSGEAPRQVVFGGGGSSSQVRQIVASVIGLPLTIPAIADVAALGAARVAAHTLGWASIDTSTEASQAPTVVNPIRAHGEIYRERLAIFRDAASRISEISHRLVGDLG